MAFNSSPTMFGRHGLGGSTSPLAWKFTRAALRRLYSMPITDSDIDPVRTRSITQSNWLRIPVLASSVCGSPPILALRPISHCRAAECAGLSALHSRMPILSSKHSMREKRCSVQIQSVLLRLCKTRARYCLDMATSVISWNKVRVRQASGLQLQTDWAYDAEGMPTTDPALAKSLSPAGGYKGFGLGMMVEILCGLIANGPIGTEILPMYSAPIEARRSISHLLMAIDVKRFIDVRFFPQ